MHKSAEFQSHRVRNASFPARPESSLKAIAIGTARYASLKVFWTATVLLFGLTSLLYAEEICMPAAELEASLIDWYGEKPVAEGPRGLVVWSSDEGNTWTLVAYKANGTACALEQGRDWNGAVSVAQLASDVQH